MALIKSLRLRHLALASKIYTGMDIARNKDNPDNYVYVRRKGRLVRIDKQVDQYNRRKRAERARLKIASKFAP